MKCILFQPLKRPILVRETPLTSLWHKKDDQFWIPKAHVLMDLRRSAVVLVFVWGSILIYPQSGGQCFRASERDDPVSPRTLPLWRYP